MHCRSLPSFGQMPCAKVIHQSSLIEIEVFLEVSWKANVKRVHLGLSGTLEHSKMHYEVSFDSRAVITQTQLATSINGLVACRSP